MSDQNNIKAFERWIRDKLNSWNPSVSDEEMQSDWEAVQQRMAEGNSVSQNKGLWFPLLLVLLVVLSSGFFLYQYINTTGEKTDALTENEVILADSMLESPIKEFKVSETETQEHVKVQDNEELSEMRAVDDTIEEVSNMEESTIADHRDVETIEENDEPVEETFPDKALDQEQVPEEDEQAEDAMHGMHSHGQSGGLIGGTNTEDASNYGYGIRDDEDRERPDDSVFCNVVSTGPQHKNLPEPGKYEILARVDTINGELDSVFRKLIITEPLEANFEVEENQPPYIRFTNLSKGGSNYYWNFGDGHQSETLNPEHEYRDTGKYEVTLIAENEFECRDTMKKEIGMYPEPELGTVPNVFTPDGSGMNEEFFVEIEGEQFFELKIYDRDGRLVFNTTDKEEAWDGRCRANRPCPAGTYYYTLRYQWMGDDEIREQSGNVSLLR